MDDTKINDKKNKEDYIFLDKNNNSENDSYLNYRVIYCQLFIL